ILRCCFFFQAEDGIRDATVTGVQTCALPISASPAYILAHSTGFSFSAKLLSRANGTKREAGVSPARGRRCNRPGLGSDATAETEIGRASCRERVEIVGVGGTVKRSRETGLDR